MLGFEDGGRCRVWLSVFTEKLKSHKSKSRRYIFEFATRTEFETTFSLNNRHLTGFIPFLLNCIIVDFKIIYKKHYPFGELNTCVSTIDNSYNDGVI